MTNAACTEQKLYARMEKLVKDYAKSQQKLTELGFNGEVLDFKPKTVMANSSVLITKDEEELIKEIMEKKIIPFFCYFCNTLKKLN